MTKSCPSPETPIKTTPPAPHKSRHAQWRHSPLITVLVSMSSRMGNLINVSEKIVRSSRIPFVYVFFNIVNIAKDFYKPNRRGGCVFLREAIKGTCSSGRFPPCSCDFTERGAKFEEKNYRELGRGGEKREISYRIAAFSDSTWRKQREKVRKCQ